MPGAASTRRSLRPGGCWSRERSRSILSFALFLFGLHLLGVGYLAYRSGYVPRLLGVLIAIAGLGYVIDTFGAVLSRGSWSDVSLFTFIGEFLLALWLVIRGRHLTVAESGLHDDRATTASEN
jgi:hypothetical protein